MTVVESVKTKERRLNFACPALAPSLIMLLPETIEVKMDVCAITGKCCRRRFPCSPGKLPRGERMVGLCLVEVKI